MLIALSVTLILLSALLLYYEFLSKRTAKESRKPTLYVARAGTEIPVYSKKGASKWLLPILVVLLFCNTLGIVYFAARLPAATPPPAASPSPSATISATESVSPAPTPIPEQLSRPYLQFVVWLDDLIPYSDFQENFSVGGWKDRTPFSVGERTYQRGIGMRVCGTSKETPVEQSETPTGFFLRDCKQVSINYALREKYSKLVFSLGVDSNDKRCFGPKEVNGVGRVTIADVSGGGRTVLFDSGWRDYSYATYEEELSMKQVDLLEITVMTCGYDGKRVTDGLRFALIDPILFLANDF